MNKLALPLFLSAIVLAHAQTASDPPTLKTVLLQQMRWTHNVKGGWFVSTSIATEGITPEQANWKDKSGNHSVSELVNHLSFWCERNLRTFNGEKLPKFTADNDTTFHSDLSWAAATEKLDQVLSNWEKAIETADDAKLQKWHMTIANVIAHNAYHTGEIVYIRRQQGSWNPEAGVH